MKLTRTSFQHGSVRKVPRSNGTFAWEFRYRVTENGARTIKQTTLDGRKYPSEAAAKKKLESLTLGLNSNSTRINPTLDSVLDQYLELEMSDKRHKSVVNYKLLIGHIRPVWGEMLLKDITPHEVETWLRSLKYSSETKRHIRNMLYRVFEFAMKRGWMEVQRNPISLIRVKAINEHESWLF